MASSSHESSSLEFSSSPELPCDVFISFRGADIRQSFASHLFGALKDTGNTVFRDDEDIKLGDNIKVKLKKAIQDSRVSIVVFSTKYAHSKWCLFELDEIVRRMDKNQLVVMPVFFHVEPREVRNQKGIYKEAFDEYKNLLYDQEEVNRWKSALKTAGGISGSDLENKSEKEVIEKIVKEVRQHLMKGRAVNGLVGIHSRVEGLTLQGKRKLHILGIHGKKGIGKTTIARVAYDRPSREFEAKYFLENVKEVFENHGEHAAVLLQNRILSEILKKKHLNVSNVDEGREEIRKELKKKRVLIVLDDLHHQNQLDNLVGNLNESDWNGSKSTIVVTTESEELLDAIRAKIYKVGELSLYESVELFKRKAFKNNRPEEDFDDLLKLEIENCGEKLPLAIEVLGSIFSSISKYKWSEELKELRDKDIEGILQEGYDRLENMEKDIFLDIACFFRGRNFYDVTKILAIFYSEQDATIAANIEALDYKSLIKVSEDKLWIHDTLKRVGQKIGREDPVAESGTRSGSRLWDYRDINRVLTTTNDQGKKAVQSIVLELPTNREIQWDGNGFMGMSNLRLLKLYKVDFSIGPTYLPNKLRYLEWHGYPSPYLPPRTTFKCLKFINLSHSKHLTQINFTTIPEVKELNLEGCTSLLEILPRGDICHEKLIYWNMKDCKNLRNLANLKIQMESLQELILSGCSQLLHLPDISGEIRLSKLHLNGTKIKDRPKSLDWSNMKDFIPYNARP